MRPLIAVIAATFLASCALPSRTPTLSENLNVKVSIDSLWTRYATAADERDSTAFGPLFAEDAALVFSNAPTVQGRGNIQTFLGALYGPVDVTGLRVTQEDLKISGTMAAQTGTFREDFIEQNRERSEYGRFALVVEKGEDGPWRIWRLVSVVDSLSQ